MNPSEDKYKIGDKVKIYIHNSKTKVVQIVRHRRLFGKNFYLFMGEFDGAEHVQWYSEKHIIERCGND